MKAKMLLTVIVSTVLLPVTSAFAQREEPHPGPVTVFTNGLSRDGFYVTPGMATVADWAELYCLGLLPDAGYVNKAPYLGFQVPRSTDDLSLVDNFQLGPDEAIVLIGLTPPPVKYFGYHAFLASRQYPTGDRRSFMATLGDAVNNVTIKTIGPTPFDTPVVFIFTPDQTTDARIRAALRRASIPPAIVNTIVIPESVVTLGHSDAADEFTMKLRIGMSEEGFTNAVDTYIRSAPTNLTVLRLTPSAPTIANPFPVPPLRVRGTGQTEMDLYKKVDQLRQALIAANPGYYVSNYLTKPNFYEGNDYIQQWVNPGADSRDALFLTGGYLPEYNSTNKITLADDEFLMVYGVNHVATGKATYMNINVYASEHAKLSIGQVFHDRLANTAAPYLPAGDPAADLLYAYKVSRNCGGGLACLPLSIDFDCPPLILNSNTVLGIIFRMYLEPATAAGPAMQEIVYDRVIKFSPRP